MFTDYFEFDTHDVPCWFNHEKEKAEKEIMIDLMEIDICFPLKYYELYLYSRISNYLMSIDGG